ncbi:hypothetical protein EB796_019893 [Bugula neritina]|uniref:Uncharacterized protein n=1 Tax=Bugula neritina TaxID=10212 RepID=A0A7J7J7Q9_BUGNE|nr:hypothetical protein EB796_019893 [Bugula neritina]
MMNTTRLDGNYGNCTRLDSNEDNMYFYPYNVSYTQWACLRTCYQKELVTLANVSIQTCHMTMTLLYSII